MLKLVRITLENADLEAFEKFEQAVLPRLHLYGGELLMRLQSQNAVSETHLLEFSDPDGFTAYLHDPVRAEAMPLWDQSGARATIEDVNRII